MTHYVASRQRAPVFEIRPVPARGPYCAGRLVVSLAAVERTRLGPWRWAALLLLGYVLARPVSTNSVLVPVLAMLGALSAGTIALARRRLAPQLVPAVFVTFAFALVGLLAGPANPGFAGGFLVFVAAPLLWWMAATAVDECTLRAVFTTLAVVTVFIGATIGLYAAGNTGVIPQILPAWLLEQYGAGFGGGEYTEVRLYGLSTLVAAGPLWVVSLFVGREALLPPHWLRLLAAVAATAGALSGGRRALALVLVLAPIIGWGLRLLLHRRSTPGRVVWGRVLVAGMAALGVVAFVPRIISGGVIGAAWQSLSSYVTGAAFPGESAADDRLRAYQAERLVDEWSEKPVFGHGFGATIDGFARDPVEPWRWELQYHGLLFQTGVVGVLLVLAGGFLTLWAVMRAARARPDLVPSLVVACTGAAGMLIGNATNPYLQAPGHVWSIFLPVAVANVMLLSSARRPAVGAPAAAGGRAPGADTDDGTPRGSPEDDAAVSPAVAR
jgi:hypothetical protein